MLVGRALKLSFYYLPTQARYHNTLQQLSNDCQHGFKKNRGTSTAGLQLQSLISRALDDDEFVAMASLDLSAAFDVVKVSDMNTLVDSL